MRHFLPLIILCFLIASCETEVHYDTEDYTPYVVVESIISTDSTWSVSLSWSQSAYDYSDPKPIDDAIIDIEVKSIEEGDIETLQKFSLINDGNGKYSYGSNPAEGRFYQMVIEVDDQIVTAETYVPRVINPQITSKVSVLNPQTNEQTLSFEFEIEEDSSGENFYAYSIEQVSTSLHPETADFTHGEVIDCPIDTSEISGKLGSKPTSKDGQEQIRLTKNTINQGVTLLDNSKGTHTIKETFLGNNKDQNGIDLDDEKIGSTYRNSTSYKLSIWAISYDYYQFLITSKQNQLATSEHTFTNTYSNINNGGGIFAGYNLWEKTYD